MDVEQGEDEITNRKAWAKLLFVYANLAEYGGSRVIHFTTKDLDEPSGDFPGFGREEGFVVYEKEGGKWKISLAKKLDDL